MKRQVSGRLRLPTILRADHDHGRARAFSRAAAAGKFDPPRGGVPLNGSDDTDQRHECVFRRASGALCVEGGRSFACRHIYTRTHRGSHDGSLGRAPGRWAADRLEADGDSGAEPQVVDGRELQVFERAKHCSAVVKRGVPRVTGRDPLTPPVAVAQPLATTGPTGSNSRKCGSPLLSRRATQGAPVAGTIVVRVSRSCAALRRAGPMVPRLRAP